MCYRNYLREIKKKKLEKKKIDLDKVHKIQKKEKFLL